MSRVEGIEMASADGDDKDPNGFYNWALVGLGGVVSLLFVVTMSLTAVIWSNVNSRLDTLSADIRVQQTENVAVKLSIQEFKTRISDLVDALNRKR